MLQHSLFVLHNRLLYSVAVCPELRRQHTDYISIFYMQKAKKSYQKDLENNQRNVDGDSSAAPGEGCFL
jgi:hypothetical protein